MKNKNLNRVITRFRALWYMWQYTAHIDPIRCIHYGKINRALKNAGLNYDPKMTKHECQLRKELN